MTLRFMVEPGHAIFFNNCTLLHNRTSFDDDGCAGHKRHLLRLWLMLDGLRPLTPDVHAYKGTTGILGPRGQLDVLPRPRDLRAGDPPQEATGVVVDFQNGVNDDRVAVRRASGRHARQRA
ncbi:MAG: TauD/TfdA family dioxygenase [Gammaproteobacteria bacterium]|nr:TauD/TfdA family dioxygenase [Gammaproteobacteria bacterium]